MKTPKQSISHYAYSEVRHLRTILEVKYKFESKKANNSELELLRMQL